MNAASRGGRALGGQGLEGPGDWAPHLFARPGTWHVSQVGTAHQPPNGKPTEPRLAHGAWHESSQGMAGGVDRGWLSWAIWDREYVAPVLADSGPLEPALAGWGLPMLTPMEPGISSLTFPVASGSTPLLHPLSPFPC